MLLGMMRRHDLDWWVVVNEEFHDDPLTPYVAPARPYAGNRDIFVFIDADEAGLRKVALTGYAEESVGTFFESAKRAAAPRSRPRGSCTRRTPRSGSASGSGDGAG